MRTEYTNGNTNYERMDSSALHHEIDRTRHDMDVTLDELGDRLQPRHLLDDLIDFARSSGATDQGRRLAGQAKETGESLLRVIRGNPIPALITAAGATWLAIEAGRERSEPTVKTTRWHRGVAAWHPDYDWTDSTEPEESWSERATAALEQLKQTLGDTSQSAADQIRAVAARVLAFSGHKRRDIHAQCADLREHSGSFVDARTGKPYTDSYERDWRNLAACDYAAECDSSLTEKEGVREQAAKTLQRVQSTLGNTGRSVREKMAELSHHIGEFVQQSQDVSSDFTHRMQERTRSLGHKASEYGNAAWAGMQQAGTSMREGTRSAARQARRSYEYSCDRLQRAADEQPLAVGLGALALGVLSGLLLPRTRTEDRLMGEAADEVKDQLRSAGRETLREGQRVASDVAQAAMDEAEQQGLTPGQMAESARETVHQAVETVRKEGKGAAGDLKQRVSKVAEAAKSTAKEDLKPHSSGAQPS